MDWGKKHPIQKKARKMKNIYIQNSQDKQHRRRQIQGTGISDDSKCHELNGLVFEYTIMGVWLSNI